MRLLILFVAVLCGLSDLGARVVTAGAKMEYTVEDLGSLGSGWSDARAINNQGQVLGSSTIASQGPQHPFIWTTGVMIDLNPAERRPGYPAALNDNGDVVGTWDNDDGTNEPFIWVRGVETPFPKPVRSGFVPTAINNAGWICGLIHTATSNAPALLHNGELTRLVTASTGYGGSAYGLNELGQVVGANNNRPFVWQDGNVTFLHTPGGVGRAYAINERGVIAGTGALQRGANRHAVLWKQGRIYDLGGLPGAQMSADAINDSGQVLGSAFDENLGNRGSFIWRPGGSRRALITLFPANSGWAQVSGVGINGRGQITGTGRHGGASRAFLLTPRR